MASHLSIFFIFAGLTGIYSVTTISKAPVKRGGSITVPCLYDSSYKNHVKYLCKGYFWNYCKYVVKTNELDSSGKYSISDDSAQRIFTVTINDLKADDTYFWCIVEINGGSDVGTYFQLSVTGGVPSLYVSDQEIIGSNGDNVTIRCHHSAPGDVQWCKLGGSCVREQSGRIDGARVTIDASVSGVSTVTMSKLRPNSSDWYWCAVGGLQMPVNVTVEERINPITPTPQVWTGGTPAIVQDGGQSYIYLKSLLIPLGLLTLLVMVTLLIWCILKRRKHSQEESSAITVGSHADNDDGVTYSTVVMKKRQTTQRTEANEDEDVTYSTVAKHRST